MRLGVGVVHSEVSIAMGTMHVNGPEVYVPQTGLCKAHYRYSTWSHMVTENRDGSGGGGEAS
jgi:hypothetical protein